MVLPRLSQSTQSNCVDVYPVFVVMYERRLVGVKHVRRRMSHLLVAVIPFTSNVTIVEGNTVGDDVGCRVAGGNGEKCSSCSIGVTVELGWEVDFD